MLPPVSVSGLNLRSTTRLPVRSITCTPKVLLVAGWPRCSWPQRARLFAKTVESCPSAEDSCVACRVVPTVAATDDVAVEDRVATRALLDVEQLPVNLA